MGPSKKAARSSPAQSPSPTHSRQKTILFFYFASKKAARSSLLNNKDQKPKFLNEQENVQKSIWCESPQVKGVGFSGWALILYCAEAEGWMQENIKLFIQGVLWLWSSAIKKILNFTINFTSKKEYYGCGAPQVELILYCVEL